jgi:hypothetical protein
MGSMERVAGCDHYDIEEIKKQNNSHTPSLNKQIKY